MQPPGADGVGNLLGPYETWMFDIGKHYDLPDLMLSDEAHLSALAEFSAPVSPAALPGLSSSLQPSGAQHCIRLPVLWRAPGVTTRFLPFLVSPLSPGAGLLRQDAAAVQNFVADFGPGLNLPAGTTGRFRMNFPVRDETVDRRLPQPAATGPRDPALAGRAPKVILAIIDHGIPFAHAAFRQADTQGTRIDFHWAQSAPSGGAACDILFGREFQRAEIDALLSRHRGDEEAAYAEAGLLSRPGGPPMPLSRLASHGAHCLDLMAGNWNRATEPEARIIAVDLPSSPVWETSGFGKDMFLLSALHYIFDRADRLRDLYGTPDLPLVINLSYGHTGGPQDGSGLIEAAMAELVAQRNLRAATTLVLPSGNSFQSDLFAHLTEAHFSGDPDSPGQRRADLTWFAPPDDRTSSFVEFWYPPGFRPQDILLSVTPPNGAGGADTAGLAPGAAGFAARPILVGGKVVGQLSIDLHRGSRWRAMICMAPTVTFADPARLQAGGLPHGPAPAGPWGLHFRLPQGLALPEYLSIAGQTLAGGIQARIQRDTSYGQGNTGARQSRFLDDLDQPFTPEGRLATGDHAAQGARLRRFGTMNGMATDPATLVCASFVSSHGRPADYASAGLVSATAPGQRIGRQVDVAAPTETSPALPGRPGAGTRSGVTFRASGTSSASPLVARILAEAQIADPLPPGATHAQVMARLAARPQASPATDPRLGEIVVQV